MLTNSHTWAIHFKLPSYILSVFFWFLTYANTRMTISEHDTCCTDLLYLYKQQQVLSGLSIFLEKPYIICHAPLPPLYLPSLYVHGQFTLSSHRIFSRFSSGFLHMLYLYKQQQVLSGLSIFLEKPYIICHAH
jgi:hypothetical protein